MGIPELEEEGGGLGGRGVEGRSQGGDELQLEHRSYLKLNVKYDEKDDEVVGGMQFTKSEQ